MLANVPTRRRGSSNGVLPDHFLHLRLRSRELRRQALTVALYDSTIQHSCCPLLDGRFMILCTRYAQLSERRSQNKSELACKVHSDIGLGSII
jgi:hypothetical protein